MDSQLFPLSGVGLHRPGWLGVTVGPGLETADRDQIKQGSWLPCPCGSVLCLSLWMSYRERVVPGHPLVIPSSRSVCESFLGMGPPPRGVCSKRV